VPPPKKPTDPPPTEETWELRDIDGGDIDDGRVRRNLRRLADVADALIVVAERHERWAVFRSVGGKFLIATTVIIAALAAFKEQLLTLFPFLRGGP